MNQHVPNLIIAMEVVDMMPPCRDAMVALPHVKHLASKYGKVRIFGKLSLKAIVGGPPEAALRIKDVTRVVEQLRLVVVNRDIQHPVAVTIASDELIVMPLHINHVDGPHKRQYTKPIEGDLEMQLGLRFDAQAADDGVLVSLLPLAKHDLTLVDSETL